MNTSSCYHCGEPVPQASHWTCEIDGAERQMCCPGCLAAAEFVRSAGLQAYYRFRTSTAPRAESTGGPDWSRYDGAALRARLVAEEGERSVTHLLVDGMRCAACAWLLERRLEQCPGEARIAVNPATGRARLSWARDATELSSLLATIAGLGFKPRPLGESGLVDHAADERRAALKRLAVAGLGMMQVMMMAVGLYAGAFEATDGRIGQYLRLVSLLVATPVLFYSGLPFLVGAWRSLLARQPGMDLPVALALLLGWAASTWNTLRGSGEVYFDSVTMFIFLLLMGRYAEMVARHHAGSTSDALLRLQPGEATRIVDGKPCRVGVEELAVGDRVRVGHGDAFPADGELEGPATQVDESLLTGEAAAVARRPGDALIGGSINLGEPVMARVAATGQDTVLSGIVRLLERAQTEKPAIAGRADRLAGWFVAGVLLAATMVAVAWWFIDPSRILPVTLAVLVVSCPCALSLATPAAITAVTGALARRGLLLTRAGAIETLAGARRMVMDKTGTLTLGRPALVATTRLGSLDASHCLALGADLEAGSSHPLAHAFREQSGTGLEVTDLRHESGRGIEGSIGGMQYRIGQAAWVAHLAGARQLDERWVYLAREGEWLACFELQDTLRPGAQHAIETLGSLGLAVEIASGDHPDAVATAARRAGIERHAARLSPGDKLARLRALQAAGEQVVMVGDGVNDAPVLAAADVSVAMGAGSALAQTSADAILMGRELTPLCEAIAAARQTLRLIRQNIAWAIGYNLLALPLAAMGWVPPWAAAVGMSASSLLVIGNSLRLRRLPTLPHAGEWLDQKTAQA